MKSMKYKVIITGSTGMVGKGVLIECLESDLIEKVTHALVRKIGEFESSKIVDIQHRRDSSSLA